MFVDITQNSLLINKWREIEGNNKMEQKKIIKLIEKSGIGLIKTVTPSNHFWLNCKEHEYFACNGSKKFTNCRKKIMVHNTMYQMSEKVIY